MLKLTLKNSLLGIAYCVISFSNKMYAQLPPDLNEGLSNLVTDAIFFTEKYITPATDAAVYQAASAWMVTPQKSELWDLTVGLHFNTIFVPNKNRSFLLSNSDLSFFQIDGATEALTPTALGNRNDIPLIGMLGSSAITMDTPEGMNRETVFYPYLQAGLGLIYGTEVIAKYSPMIKLKNVDYQVYGIGLKHSISQYFSKLEENDFHLAVMATYSKEDLTVNFLDVVTDYGSFGINKLNNLISSYQFQINGSKKINNLEFMGGFIYNSSSFEYAFAGTETNTLGFFKQIFNENLRSINDTRSNYIGEVSVRYQVNKLYIQPVIAIGKFVNTNISVQYKFN